jgi:hypothetical protein
MKLRRKPKAPPKDDETPQENPPSPGAVRRENQRHFERAVPPPKETR